MEKNFIFVNYSGPIYDYQNLFPDNGLALLATVLKEHGFNPYIADFCNLTTFKYFFSGEIGNKIKAMKREIEKLDFLSVGTKFRQEIDRLFIQAEELVIEDILKLIRKQDPVAIGFKLWGGLGTVGTFRITKRLKKEFPNLKIILGGPQSEIFREEILKAAPQVDYIIYGEGEKALPRLLEQIYRGSFKPEELPTLIYRDGNEIKITNRGEFVDIGELPVPIYSSDIYPAMDGEKLHIFLIEESRGCPNHCNFCIHPQKAGNRYRLKSVEQLQKEIELTSSLLESTFFRFTGSNPPAKQIDALYDILKQGKYTYSLFGYLNSPFNLNRMKESGCAAIFYGLESGSKRIQKEMFDKRIDFDRAEKVFHEAAKLGIYTIASLILPTPFETEESELETLELIKRCKPSSVLVQLPYLDPGTIWWESAEKFGFKFKDREILKRKLLLYANKFVESKLERLPYKIGDMDTEHAVLRLKEFSQCLQENNIGYSINDSVYLCSKILGEPAAEVNCEINDILIQKDSERLEEITHRINSALKKRYLELKK